MLFPAIYRWLFTTALRTGLPTHHHGELLQAASKGYGQYLSSLFITCFSQKIIPYLPCLATATWEITWAIWMCIWHSEVMSITGTNGKPFLSFWDSFLSHDPFCRKAEASRFSFPPATWLEMPNSCLHFGSSLLLWYNRNLHMWPGVNLCPFYRVCTHLDG